MEQGLLIILQMLMQVPTLYCNFLFLGVFKKLTVKIILCVILQPISNSGKKIINWVHKLIMNGKNIFAP